jgi:hypothetical protein
MRSTTIALCLLLVACTKPNPNRCCTDEADCTAKGIPTGSMCEQGLVCVGNQCISVPCADATDCNATAPYCVSELCSEGCSEDAQCPGFMQDTSIRYCVGGDCVTCRDSNDCGASVCEAGACRACVAHAECASQVCEQGQCLDQTIIAYAAPSGSSSSGCTLDMPCTLERALSVIDATRTAIKLLPGTHEAPSTGTLEFTKPQQLTIYGPATIHGSFYVNPMIGTAAQKARLQDLSIQGGAACYTNLLYPVATLELIRVTVNHELIGQSDQYAVHAQRCVLTVRDSRIKAAADPYVLTIRADNGGNSTGGQVATIERSVIQGIGSAALTNSPATIIVDDNGSLRISNSVIRDSSPRGAIYFGTYAAVSLVSFTTFYNSVLTCPTGNLLLASNSNVFLNEAAGAPADTVTGTACSHSYALVKPQAATPTGSNNKLNMDPRFVDPANGDFHLSPGSPAIDAADPAATEPVDLEGTSRPKGAGRDMGALESM